MNTETKTTHTPGPWSAHSGPPGWHNDVGGHYFITGDHGRLGICITGALGQPGTPQEGANARLIAAAPDLLDAVRRSLAGLLTAIAYMENDEEATAPDVEEVHMDLEAAYAAIARATGAQ